MFAGSVVPAGWLECNGQSTSGYAALAAVVGSNVPDLRGEFVRGFDNGRGIDAGRNLLSAQGEEFKSHTHIQNAHKHSLPSPVAQYYGFADSAAGAPLPRVSGQAVFDTVEATATNQNTGGSETRPRNVALMYIIRY